MYFYRPAEREASDLGESILVDWLTSKCALFYHYS